MLESLVFSMVLPSVQFIFVIEKFGNTIMKEKDLEFFRHLLVQWMEELLDHADDTVEGLLSSLPLKGQKRNVGGKST
jgi:hypothetical protein